MIKSIFRFCLFFLSIIFFVISSVNAQYFYKDILSNVQINEEFSILKNENIKTIKLNSFEDNDEPSDGFFCEKKFNKNYTQSEMLSKSYITGQSLLVTDYNLDGRVIKTNATTPTTTNITEFEYNNKGLLTIVRTFTKADEDSSGITETHEYSYSDNGAPLKMLRKKNNALIATITFKSDDKGNIIEEDAEGNSNDKKYFYYYDDKNRLTDVVHYNEIAKKLLPDYMFEYTTSNKPQQMISIDESGRNYFIWKYSYTEKKLPEIQKCFSKEKRLLGTIQYEYQ